MSYENNDSKSDKQLSWLITGGCGFIGKRLISTLIKKYKNIDIRVLDNLSVGSKEDFDDFVHSKLNLNGCENKENINKVELLVGDIRDFESCSDACIGMDVVVHLAANTGVEPSIKNPRNDLSSNVIGTFNMLEAAKQKNVSNFVFASSGAPVGECQPPIHEELAPHPVSPYGASKLAGEAYCSAYFRSFGLRTVALRFGNVYGPGSDNKSSVVAKFIKKALAHRPIEIYGDGQQTRDFVYVDDLIHAIILSATNKNVGGEIFQIATNRESTISHLVELLDSLLKKYNIDALNVTYSDYRVGDVLRNYSDTTKAQTVLGWKPMTSLKRGLELTLDWFLSNQQ